MKQLTFTRAPVSFDQYGQPQFIVDQSKGLSESQSNDLLHRALLDGYIFKVAHDLKKWVREQVVAAARGQQVDLLEIGGGNGAFFDSLRDVAHSYVNVEPGRIDLSQQDAQRLKDPKYVAIKCSAEDIPLPDNCIDVVVSIASLDHVPNYRKVLREVSRLLRDDGVFVLTLNNRRSWWKALLARTNFLKAREEEIAREHYFQWSFTDCESNLAEYLDVKTASTTTFFPFVRKGWRFLLPPADALGKLFIPRRGANVLMVCRKPNRQSDQ